MSVRQGVLLSAAHNNQQLFSDHYLDAILPDRADWLALAAEAAPVRAGIAALLDGYTPSTNEAQVEQEIVRPVLALLGHTFEVQPALRTPDGTKKPDYLLYADPAARDANKNKVLDEALLAPGGLAVADAKYWDRPLDVAIKGAGDPFTNKHPGYQIAFYIQHSGLAWGVLTNGRRWRLYHRDTAHKLDRYYEVDLPALVRAADPAPFLYFYAFFRRAALTPGGGPLALDALLAASRDYARDIGDTLKAQVYDALRHLAQGFLDYPGNRLGTDPATLREIYDNSLIVLYRLLFILYAEARELLPLRENADYRESYSLQAIARDGANNLRLAKRLLPMTATLWPRLTTLFGLISLGSPPLRIATFNGGLFDPDRHLFLARHTVGDARLQAAIDMLARVGGEFVDYRDLAERHLGTIYEGLLEFHLTPIAPEGDWTIALLNDKGQRHATGSYYTPDYVVQYIVDQAVGPVLRAAVADQPTDAEKIAAVLAVNVLDPAMGSGHFPVAAMEYIARFLVDLAVAPAADATPPPGGPPEPDLAYWKRRVAQNCIYGVDLNPLAVDLAKLSLWLATVAKDRPLSFLDHHLRAGNALVGARLDELAGAPAAAGRERQPAAKAKRGARERRIAAGQAAMFADDAFRRALSHAVDFMWLIEGTAGDTVAEVKEQERVYAALREELNRKYERLANLEAARHFGLDLDPNTHALLTKHALGETIGVPARFTGLLTQVDEIAAAQRFFHWELEFPEVFFDRAGQPLGEAAGFDAVIGNPPYVRQEQMGPYKPYLAQARGEVYDGVADLYVYFYHLGVEMLRVGGKLSYIVTNKWLRAGYGEPLRRYFAERAAVERIVDFGHAPIFPDADVFPCIVVLRKRRADDDATGQTEVCLFPREALGRAQIAPYIEAHSYPVPMLRFGAKPWSLETGDVDALMAKIRGAGVPLAENSGAKLYRGLLTGFNEAFLIDTQAKEKLITEGPSASEIIKPYLRGQDVKRWSPDWQGLWIILLKSSGDHTWPWSEAGADAEGIFERIYPSLYQHMKPLEEQLRKRQDKGRHWWELRACAYYGAYEGPKIIYQEIQFHPSYGYDDRGFFTNNKAFIIPNADPYVLAVLNSPLMWWHNWRYLPHMKDEALSPVGTLMETLPIAPPTDAARAEAEPAVARLIALTQERRQGQRDVLDWLRVEFAVESPGQRLAAPATLDGDAFIEEVRRRRPKSAARLTPAGLRELRDTHAASVGPLRALAAEAQGLEQRLSALVNAAYGLNAADVDLLWRTAPPRMPGSGETAP